MGNSSKSNRKERILSTYEAIQLMLGFGSFLLTLIGLVVVIVKMSNKK